MAVTVHPSASSSRGKIVPRPADAVQRHVEAHGADAPHVQEGDRQDAFHVAVHGARVLLPPAQLLPGGARDLAVQQGAHLGRLVRVQEHPAGADELQRVPLDRVVAGGHRQPARGLQVFDGQLHAGRGRDADVDHVAPGGLQRGGGGAREHGAADAAVAADHHRAAGAPAPRIGAERRREPRDHLGGQAVAHAAAHARHAHHQLRSIQHVPVRGSRCDADFNARRGHTVPGRASGARNVVPNAPGVKTNRRRGGDGSARTVLDLRSMRRMVPWRAVARGRPPG